MSKSVFALAGSDHLIVPVMIGDASLAQKMTKECWIMEFMSLGFLFL